MDKFGLWPTIIGWVAAILTSELGYPESATPDNRQDDGVRWSGTRGRNREFSISREDGLGISSYKIEFTDSSPLVEKGPPSRNGIRHS